MVREKRAIPNGVQDLCRKLKSQLDDLAAILIDTSKDEEEAARREQLMEKLKTQLAELSQ